MSAKEDSNDIITHAKHSPKKKCESPSSNEKEIINIVDKIIQKYRDNTEYLQEFSVLASQIEEQLVYRVEQRQRIQEKRDLCRYYLQQFIDHYGDDYWYHPYTQSYYHQQSSRLYNIPEDRLQPIVSAMLQDSHQQYRDEILGLIKKKIQDRTLLAKPTEDRVEFIPTGTMILKISNLFMDTFMDRSRVEYFLWFLGLAVYRALHDTRRIPSETKHNHVMIWNGSQIDVWIEWLKQAIHYHFRSYSAELSEVKTSFHTSYPLPLIRVIHFSNDGYTLRSKCSSDNDSLLLLLVSYHFYRRYQQGDFHLDMEKYPHCYFLSQFRTTQEFFSYFVQKSITIESEDNPSGCYISDIVDQITNYLSRSRLPKNVISKKEVYEFMERFYPSYRKTKQWYQGLVLHNIVKSKFIVEYIETIDNTLQPPDCIPLTIEQLLNDYHKWTVKPPLKRYSDLPKKEFIRYLRHFYPDRLIRDETAFQCYLENFSVAGIIRQYYEHQNDSTEYQNFVQWYSEVYPHYEQITSWQFKMYQDNFNLENTTLDTSTLDTPTLDSSVSTLSPSSSLHHDDSNVTSDGDPTDGNSGPETI